MLCQQPANLHHDQMYEHQPLSPLLFTTAMIEHSFLSSSTVLSMNSEKLLFPYINSFAYIFNYKYIYISRKERGVSYLQKAYMTKKLPTMPVMPIIKMTVPII